MEEKEQTILGSVKKMAKKISSLAKEEVSMIINLYKVTIAMAQNEGDITAEKSSERFWKRKKNVMKLSRASLKKYEMMRQK